MGFGDDYSDEIEEANKKSEELLEQQRQEAAKQEAETQLEQNFSNESQNFAMQNSGNDTSPDNPFGDLDDEDDLATAYDQAEALKKKKKVTNTTI